MNKSPATLIAPTVMIVLASIVAFVMLAIGLPMGGGTAFGALIGAAALTAGLVWAYTHEPGPGH